MFNSFTTPISNITTNKYTGHDCVVYIVNPKNPIEAIVADYNCDKFGKYGNNKKKTNPTPEILNIRENVSIRSNLLTKTYPVTSIGTYAFTGNMPAVAQYTGRL